MCWTGITYGVGLVVCILRQRAKFRCGYESWSLRAENVRRLKVSDHVSIVEFGNLALGAGSEDTKCIKLRRLLGWVTCFAL